MSASFYQSDDRLLCLLFPTVVDDTQKEAAFKVICELAVIVKPEEFDAVLMPKIRPFCKSLDTAEGGSEDKPELAHLKDLLEQKIALNRDEKVNDNHFSHTWLSLRIYI